MRTLSSKGRVLVVDDEPNAIKVLSAILAEDGYDVLGAWDVDSAAGVVESENIDVVITDMKMPGKTGIELFEYLKRKHPDLPVIFLTAYGSVETAVNTVTQGAFYYFTKPPDYNKLKSMVAKAVEQMALKRELALLKKKLAEGSRFFFIAGSTPGMKGIVDTIEAVKNSESSVLICGETGTGKDLIAKTLHSTSVRKDRAFVAVNCAALPRDLMESELFGYEKGAFTGAVARRTGKFEEAEGGTVFLDEIGELELSLQAKLLRVLQEREIERLGSNRKTKVDFRLISSTNRDLKKEVESGAFRRDLFYRINVVQINVPSLRERKVDIPLIVSEFVKEFCARENKVLAVAPEVMMCFEDYHWPGNIRQLKNLVERAVVLARKDKITLDELPEEFLAASQKRPGTRKHQASNKTLKELENEAIKETLKECKGNKSKAAKMLGISRKAFYKKLKEDLPA